MKFIQEILISALEAQGLPGELAVVTRSDRPDMADYQSNAALTGARIARQSPKELAQAIVDSVEDPRVLVSVSGPGFINFKVIDYYLADALVSPRPRESKGELLVLDYGGPNVAKAMHVGHLRSLVIGDSLNRILRYQGYDTTSDIHWGDWGLQMGMILTSMWEDVSKDVGATLNMEYLQELYPRSAARAKENEEFRYAAQRLTRRLQDGDVILGDLWQQILDVTQDSVYADLETLGIQFDLMKGESDVADILPMLEGMLRAKHMIHESSGALVVPCLGAEDPPLIFVNGEGGYLYGATDLATIVDRATLDPKGIIYIVDQRQELHFRQVFDIAERLGYQMSLSHAGFGTVQGPDGKPLKTRAGGVPTLRGMLDEAVDKALLRTPDPESARRIAVAAIKFNDLQNKRQTNYVYDLDRALAHEGKTGPYLLYQVVRIKGILGKRTVEPGKIILREPLERDIAMTLLAFQDTLDKCEATLSPHYLAEYLFGLAQRFSVYYAGTKISSDESALSLVTLVLQTLEVGLGLLGIETVEAM